LDDQRALNFGNQSFQIDCYRNQAYEAGLHGAWDANVDDKSLSDLSFDFLVEQQELIVDKLPEDELPEILSNSSNPLLKKTEQRIKFSNR